MDNHTSDDQCAKGSESGKEGGGGYEQLKGPGLTSMF